MPLDVPVMRVMGEVICRGYARSARGVWRPHPAEVLDGAMEKLDLRRASPELYAPSAREFGVVEVPRFEFLAVDGSGDPNTSRDYADAVASLYALSYAAKSASKRMLARDYVVAPLEGLWLGDSPEPFVTGRRADWRWTMLIRQPDWLTAEVRGEARAAAAKKAEVDGVREEALAEGLSVQILHIGGYDDEAPTIARLHDEFLPQKGYVENGPHHEIYLSDPRRVAPEKLRTVLRQPVRTA